MSIDEEDNMEELEDIKEQALLNKKEFMNKIGEEFIIVIFIFNIFYL